jgi:GntR family transcriptional regulator, transcriptional repressor for pyruvate dehydrogenase complex
MSTLVRSPSLADRVADQLEAMILDGTLEPGQRLIAERELAVKLGVSRPSLRDGLALLEERGLVRTTKKDGTMVAQFLAPLATPLARLLTSDPRVAEDYFEYRRLIEPQAAGLAAERATEPDRAALGRCIETMVAASAAADPRAEAAADVALHRAIYDATHNLVLLHTMRVFSDMLRGGILTSREEFFHHDAVRAALLEQHRRIVAAILAREPEAATVAMREHIAFTAQTFGEIRQAADRLARSMRKGDGRQLLDR